MKYYAVIQDRQGGEFGMHRVFSAQGWGEQAYDWANGDDYENPNEWLRSHYKTDKSLILDIADWWELTFAELNEEQMLTYEKYEAQLDLLNEMIGSADWNNDNELKDKLTKKRYEVSDKYWEFIETLKEVQ